MKLSLMEKLPVLPHMPLHTKLVRRRAPRYVKSVIEETKALPEIDSVQEMRPEHFNALTGGNLSATYLVRSPLSQVIIKLRSDSVEAEAEALIKWKERRVHVPKVIAYGIVPASKKEKVPIKYLILEAILDTNGRIAETCDNYLVAQPQKARTVGRQLGAELTKLHSVVAKRRFGDYADVSHRPVAYRTWNKYVIGYVEQHQAYFESLTNKELVGEVKRFIKHHRFTSRPRYVHGDFSVRNSLIVTYNPLKIVVFDPNPLVGDPTWDIAVVLNNYVYQKYRLKYERNQQDLYKRDQQLWIGFKQTYDRKIDEKGLLVSQLIHAVFQIGYQNGKKKWRHDPNGLKAYEEMITDLIHMIAKEARAYADK